MGFNSGFKGLKVKGDRETNEDSCSEHHILTTFILYRPKFLQIHSYGFRERDVLVGVVIRQRDEWSGVQIPISQFFSFTQHTVRIWGPRGHQFKGFCPQAKRPGHKDNHSSPSSAKKMNEWSCASNVAACTGTNLPLNMAV